MSVLFGWIGPPDDALIDHMRQTLAHRGQGPLVVDVTAEATLAYRPAFDPDTEAQLGSGLISERIVADEPVADRRLSGKTDFPRASSQDEVSLVVAGFLTHAADSDEPPTPATLLRRYRQQGLKWLPDLGGAFVLAIRHGRIIHLVRDGVGGRTLFYTSFGQRTLFAIEPKALWSLPGFARKLRPGAVAEYLSFSFLPGAATMLEGVFELPAGHTVTLEPDQPPKLQRYFTFEEIDQQARGDISETQWTQDFRWLMGQEVRRLLRPAEVSEPVAVLLSGGLDSSLVTAELADQYTGPIHSFSIHFGSRYPHELEFAQAVALRCKTVHHEVLIRPRDFLPNLRQMIWHLDDPIGDPITMPNYELAARIAAEGFRWVFNGEGGDPCFGGPKNIPMMLAHWYGGVPREADFREQAYLTSYRRGYEEIARLLRPEFRQEVEKSVDLEGILRPFFRCQKPRLFLDKLTALNIRLKGAHLILPKVERMMAAYGCLPLSPLFSQQIVRFSFAMPAKLKLCQGVEKVILKRAYATELPQSVIDRPKSGMRVPVHFWFQGELKRYARCILSRRAVQRAGIFDPNRVRQLLDYSTEEGPGRYGLRLWMLLTFEIWRRIVIEGEAP